MNVFLAGKVASSIRLPSDGFSEELTLATERNQLAFIRRDTPDSTESTMFRRGDVVYALGRVAAIGRARDATGREHQAAYFLASVIDVYIYPMEVWSHALQGALDRLVRMYGWGRNIRPLKP